MSNSPENNQQIHQRIAVAQELGIPSRFFEGTETLSRDDIQWVNELLIEAFSTMLPKGNWGDPSNPANGLYLRSDPPRQQYFGKTVDVFFLYNNMQGWFFNTFNPLNPDEETAFIEILQRNDNHITTKGYTVGLSVPTQENVNEFSKKVITDAIDAYSMFKDAVEPIRHMLEDSLEEDNN